MESISSAVKQIIDSSPFLHEMLIQGILSYSNYAQSILPTVSQMHGKEAKVSAVVMAIRRYAEELRKRDAEQTPVELKYEIVMKTNIYALNLSRGAEIMVKLGKLYDEVSSSKGDFLNITLGNNEVSISFSDKYLSLVESLVHDEPVLYRKNDLVALSIVFAGDFMSTPGIVYEAVRKLAWEQVNVNEIISTLSELTFVISREDSMKAFAVLQSFLSEQL